MLQISFALKIYWYNISHAEKKYNGAADWLANTTTVLLVIAKNTGRWRLASSSAVQSTDGAGSGGTF